MTFPIVGSECASGITDRGPSTEPGAVQSTAAAIDLVHLFALDRLPAGRRRLVCRWHRVEGRLGCIWGLPDEARG